MCVLKEKVWNNLLDRCDGNEILSVKILYRANKRNPHHLSGLIKNGFKEGWILIPDIDEEFSDPRILNNKIHKFLRWIDFMGWKRC